jgi:hypothetical protein
MLDATEHELQRSRYFVSTRVTPDLHASIAADCARTGLSKASVVRLRIQYGRLPAFPKLKGAA